MDQNSLNPSQRLLSSFLRKKIGEGLFKSSIFLGIFSFYILMFAPLTVVVCKSFIAKNSIFWMNLDGFKDIFRDQALLQSALHSLLLGISSACMATVLGTISAFTQYWSKNRTQQFCSYIGLIITIILPEIALAIFLLGWLSFLKIPLGFSALLLAHTTFCIPFVAFLLWSQLRALDHAMIEASRDLGAKTSTIFFKIILPQVYSTLAASFLLCFFLSIDDVVISSFFASPTYQTLSLYIYAAGRLGIKQHLNALATILLVVSSSFFWLALRPWMAKPVHGQASDHSSGNGQLWGRGPNVFKSMLKFVTTKLLYPFTGTKKIFSHAAGLMVVVMVITPFISRKVTEHHRQRGKNLYLYTWSGYFPPAILDQFYLESGYKVFPTYFSSNEELYAQLDSYPDVPYDLILPSSYILRHFLETNKIQPFPEKFSALLERVKPELLKGSLSNSTDINSTELTYTIPYLWGATGLGLRKDSSISREMPKLKNWKALWDPALKGKIFALDDAKEMFYVARLALKDSSLPKEPEKQHSVEIEREKLSHLMQNIQAFSPADAPHLPFLEGQADLGILWNGSANLLTQEEIPIEFVWPEEGALLWIDNFCLPQNAVNIEAAYAFIEFVSRPEIAAKIVELTGFPTPYRNVEKFLPETLQHNQTLFPPKEIVENLLLLEFDPSFNQEEQQEIEFQKLKLGL